MSSRGPIWFGVALVVIVAAIGAWIYFLQPSQGLNVGIQLATNPTAVLLGDPFDLSVTLSNTSASAMQTSSIEIVLPSGVVAANTPDQRVITQNLGTIAAGGVSHQDFDLVETSAANTVSDITARVTYSTDGSSAQFENDGSIDVPVGQPAVTVSISAPPQVFSGQNFPVTAQYINNTDHPVENMSLVMQYPSGFTPITASSSWNLGTIAPQATGTVTVTGNLVGPGGGSYPIGAAISESIGDQNYTISNPVANIGIAESPLTFTIEANGSQNYISSAGNSLNYVLTFTNNSGVTFQNLVISALLSGTMFDLSSIQTAGVFNSLTNVIAWNAAADSQLLSLAPGQSGSVSFYISTKSAFPIRLPSDKDYSVSVAAKIQSPTVPPDTAASSTMSVADITTKLGGKIVLAAQGYQDEPKAGVGGSLGASGIVNTGPYPPRINQPTEYTVHWLLTNYATDADNVTISAYLESGATCTSAAMVPASTTFTCNAANGELTWQIPVVPATTGIADKPLEAVFQITNTPGANQLGQTLTLVGPATLTATDGFTSSTMQASAGPISTALPDDTSISTNNRNVSQ